MGEGEERRTQNSDGEFKHVVECVSAAPYHISPLPLRYAITIHQKSTSLIELSL
jgi:hypothetical protein